MGSKTLHQQNPQVLNRRCRQTQVDLYTHTHTRLTALYPGLPGWGGTRKVKPVWILLKQEIVSGSGISWAICKSAPRSRQKTTPAPHRSVFYRPDALPAAQPTASKHWRYTVCIQLENISFLSFRCNFVAYSYTSSSIAVVKVLCNCFVTDKEWREKRSYITLHSSSGIL